MINVENVNKNYAPLTEEELLTTEGGFVVETAAVIYVVKAIGVGVALVAGTGAFVGYTNAKRP